MRGASDMTESSTPLSTEVRARFPFFSRSARVASRFTPAATPAHSGRVRSASSAALADQEAALADFHGARLSLVGQTCKAWFASLEATRQAELARATVENYRSSEKQVRERYERGLRSALDLRLARANLATAEDNLEAARARREEGRPQEEDPE